MSDQMLLGAIIGPMYLVLGLSLLLYSGVWQKIAGEWGKNHLSMLTLMCFNLIFGLVVINLHNVWEWSPYVIITVTGWGAFLKAVVYFLVPGDSLKAMLKMLNCKCYFQVSGAIIGLLGAWLSYIVYLA
ncbi:hypothetical protein KJ807_02280 [Patescibacteria group bacterium]|nr:hypothetical protein [Patescibacteria group bacterium]MBU1613587.1 hypothetical protein [Patescibacteria group bacterium]